MRDVMMINSVNRINNKKIHKMLYDNQIINSRLPNNIDNLIITTHLYVCKATYARMEYQT